MVVAPQDNKDLVVMLSGLFHIIPKTKRKEDIIQKFKSVHYVKAISFYYHSVGPQKSFEIFDLLRLKKRNI